MHSTCFMVSRLHLNFFIFGTIDNLILDGFADFAPVLCKASYTNHQVTILVRCFLRFFQCVGAYHVELYVETAFTHIGTNQFQQFSGALYALNRRRMQFQVHLCILVLRMIVNGRRFKEGIYAVFVCAWSGRYGTVGVCGAC